MAWPKRILTAIIYKKSYYGIKILKKSILFYKFNIMSRSFKKNQYY